MTGLAMKVAALPFLVAPAIVSGISLAQAANETKVQLRACPPMESAARSECLDAPSRPTAPLPRLALAGDGWVISETTSPVDYSPIATATTSSLDAAGGSQMRLSIRCRGGRTEMTVAGPAITRPGSEYFIFYRVNGGRSGQFEGAAPAFGDGVALKGDVVALLQSLPTEGTLLMRVVTVSGKPVDGIFSLNGLETPRERISATCRWPHAVAKPNDGSSYGSSW
jgi:hypothetical protein